MARNGTTRNSRKATTKKADRNEVTVGVIADATSKGGFEYQRLILDVDAVRELLDDKSKVFKSKSTGNPVISLAVFAGQGKGKNLSFVKA